MQGRKVYQEKLFVNFQLSDHVPEDNLYRRILGLIDFGYLYKLTAKYYGREGQKSIDPVVFMKLMLVGYLENITSDRRIIEVSRLRMDILFFLGYDLGECLPWHSTLSRTRQLYGQEVFTAFFRDILSRCIDKGMLSGRRQAIDGFFIKANASLDNMVRRDILEDAQRYAKELEEQVEDPSARTVELPHNKNPHSGLSPKKNPKNATHVNPHDPEAKMSVKPGKATALNYLGEVSVDTGSHVITHVQAFTADKRDSQCLPEVLDGLTETLSAQGLSVDESLADKGFSSGEALRSLEEHGITGYIPNRGQFVFEREGFVYHPQKDSFTCANGKELTYRGTYKAGNYYNKDYAISRRECAICPLSGSCSAYNRTKREARIKETVDRPFYERMHHRMESRKGRRMMKIRQSTVEPVIGSLTNHFGMKKVNTIGLPQANKCITMSGAAYNLKKLAKYISSQKRKAVAQSKKALEKHFLERIGAFFRPTSFIQTTFVL